MKKVILILLVLTGLSATSNAQLTCEALFKSSSYVIKNSEIQSQYGDGMLSTYRIIENQKPKMVTIDDKTYRAYNTEILDHSPGIDYINESNTATIYVPTKLPGMGLFQSNPRRSGEGSVSSKIEIWLTKNDTITGPIDTAIKALVKQKRYRGMNLVKIGESYNSRATATKKNETYAADVVDGRGRSIRIKFDVNFENLSANGKAMWEPGQTLEVYGENGERLRAEKTFDSDRSYGRDHRRIDYILDVTTSKKDKIRVTVEFRLKKDDIYEGMAFVGQQP